MKFNKFIIGLLLLISFATFYQFDIAKAEDSNMDGGGSGGGTQHGSSSNYYSSGDDGVRITVIDSTTNKRAEGTVTIDYSRYSKSHKDIIHFGKYCKLEYMGVGGYGSCRTLKQSSDDYVINDDHKVISFSDSGLPTIVSSSRENSNINAIKKYFNNESQLRAIASRTGLTYDELISGKYKIIIEPIIYLTYESKYIALTAHEAAKLDMALGGTLTSGGGLFHKFMSFTHKNLPLAIFLKRTELGVKRWTGSKYNRVNNKQILTYLGIGILSFTSKDTDVDMDGGSFTYRPDTDVITSVNVSVGPYGYGATCDNPISVQFSGDMIPTTLVTGIVIPANGSRLVWFKWHTPKVTEKTKTVIHVSIAGGSSSADNTDLLIKIYPIQQKEPPNPKADDEKPSTWSDVFLPSIPDFPKTGALYDFHSPQKSKTWHTYTCTKRIVYDGTYEDAAGNIHDRYHVEYDFSVNTFSASLIMTNASIKPDSTVANTNPHSDKIKSGYGIEMKLNSVISASASYNSTSGIQTAVVYFPEFEYKNFRRIGTLPGADLNSNIEFPVNLYSIYKRRIHFLPIWYPDTEYKIYIESLDAWTPAGMLCDYTTASIHVKGSMWDDFHIGVIPNMD